MILRTTIGSYVALERFAAMVLLLVLIMVNPATAQMREFGYVEATYRESFEAGVHGFNIVRSGPEGNLSACVFTVEVFGKGQKLLGVSEVKFPTPSIVEITHVMPDGETYHVTHDEDLILGTFEHVGGDWYRTQVLCDTDIFDDERKAIEDAELEADRRGDREELIKLKKHDREDLIKRVNECLAQVELTGNTSKTFEELQSDHEVVNGIIGAAVGELRRLVDIPFKQERERRALELERSRAGSQAIWFYAAKAKSNFATQILSCPWPLMENVLALVAENLPAVRTLLRLQIRGACRPPA